MSFCWLPGLEVSRVHPSLLIKRRYFSDGALDSCFIIHQKCGGGNTFIDPVLVKPGKVMH